MGQAHQAPKAQPATPLVFPQNPSGGINLGGKFAPFPLCRRPPSPRWARGEPNRPPTYKRRGRGRRRHTPSHLAGRPLSPSSIPLSRLGEALQSFSSTTTTTPSCCWDFEEIYHTSAARWNGERKDFIYTIRTTEYGSAAGLQHRSIDYINNEI